MKPQAVHHSANIMDPSLQPVYRRLRGYAFDPSFAVQLNSVGINTLVYPVRWEGDLKPGPIGEYVEVVDVDPASGVFYPPLDLNDPILLAQDGLPPSEGNPQFHQQMVYAVAMTTIQNFEKALGRPVLWSSREGPIDADGWPTETYVQRLRLYPHALRDANAYYSPSRKAILFGYFPARPSDVTALMPGSLVFTCLSHDIITHEVTHALIDGIHKGYIVPLHRDTLAIHEAFSDLVALFQHFTFTDLIENQIARTRGDLRSDNWLAQLAQQMGLAVGNHGSLRNAIGNADNDEKEWRSVTPNPKLYEEETEPHARGSILVAAVFDAFLNIYRKRTADLYRIATNGTGVMPAGDLHPDLVRRLASEASRTAKQFLTVCIRALDYCPPVGSTFGDFLRAVITADVDLVPNDPMGYRVAFVESFKRWGIYPTGIRTLSVENLTYSCFQESDLLPMNSLAPTALDSKSIEASEPERFKRRVDDLLNEIYYLPAEWLRLQGKAEMTPEQALPHTWHVWLDTIRPLYAQLIQPITTAEQQPAMLNPKRKRTSGHDSLATIKYLVRKYFDDTSLMLQNREALFNLTVDYKRRIEQAIREFDGDSLRRFQGLMGLLLNPDDLVICNDHSVTLLNKALRDELNRRGMPERMKEITVEWVKIDEQEGCPNYGVYTLSRAQRIGPETNVINQVVMTIMQTCQIKLAGYDAPYGFKGGCTIVLNIDQRTTRFIRKDMIRLQNSRYVISEERAAAEIVRLYCYVPSETESPFAPRLVGPHQATEAFAILHQGH
ncbi:hypothetical protein BN8_05532 [Fibrisoma limi BUZ 3]|uniref:Peptidase M4 n=1 Tax=Fibrisoma limi BUZ 3 TaxID=1185876 RepID=I2GQN4_9BACT|nr:hypothetical protein [Fibrisoma limi]CCH56212.1 hypothetical protein BN8_05532 [Fibrisoma limi BUZ 3]